MDNSNQLEERLFSMLPPNLIIPKEKWQRDAQLDEIGFDSLALAEFIFKIEDQYNVRFTNTGALPATLGEVFDLIHQTLNNAGKQI